MTVIFKDLLEETLSKVSKFVKDNTILVRFASFALVSVIALVVSIISCGITVGFNVKYSGKNIAVVSGTSVFKEAKQNVADKIDSENGADAIAKPKFSITVTSKDNLYCKDRLADAIIENTDGISFSSALTVNGEVIAHADREDLKDVIDSALCKYYVKGAQNNSTFVDDVEVTDGYCLNEDIKDLSEVK